jgi:hypothetical protein
MRSLNLSPNHKRRIKTILHQFRNKHARARSFLVKRPTLCLSESSVTRVVRKSSNLINTLDAKKIQSFWPSFKLGFLCSEADRTSMSLRRTNSGHLLVASDAMDARFEVAKGNRMKMICRKTVNERHALHPKSAEAVNVSIARNWSQAIETRRGGCGQCPKVGVKNRRLRHFTVRRELE